MGRRSVCSGSAVDGELVGGAGGHARGFQQGTQFLLLGSCDGCPGPGEAGGELQGELTVSGAPFRSGA
jgi:hypothetical protein